MKKWLVTIGLALTLTACGAADDPDEVVQSPTVDEEITEEAPATEQEEGVFKIAVIPSQSMGEMQTGLDNLETHLSESLGREVVVEQYPNYNAVVEAINYHHIDLAFLGPLTYLIAHEQSGAQAIITQEVDGSPFYYSYIITHADREWEDLDEMLEDRAEVDFAFASISSTSGHLIPGLHLRNLGHYDSEDDHEFNQIQFAGSHDIVTTLVRDQTVDAGAVDSAILEALMKEDEANGGSLREDIKVIWQSEQLYQYPWVVPADTSDALITQLQEAYAEIEDPEILRIFGGATRFVEADDSQYADVLEAAREFDMLSLN
ncbi:phosphate/phosphite/phosphonate ABC transporter substrate-binding protein [Halalkalibacter akibai]|uniref:Phosphonate ABC transporter phosphate-binding periplasmic component n=1 Tax=Halalkalibacter akibai (strain ATCC 43226 / DSM 21942 / CIP 109018 / JCM 9157 / 1139) TaxID=1236973 RepID=W4QVQ8_HALA3|nr:phosphate/phosphite/phosphonate ABC transporter substrate-binding protein [Halalkalibacter akibai]GAE35718.1 phosphonate ABC transporter phosphate-binding periplasmic component [Halalkalibacter akibai JCM 9157]